MTKAKKSRSDWGPMTTVNYYAQGLLDLEDIVQCIDGMIKANVDTFEQNNLKKICSVSAIPLKDRMAGMIVKITLPSIVLSGKIQKNYSL